MLERVGTEQARVSRASNEDAVLATMVFENQTKENYTEPPPQTSENMGQTKQQSSRMSRNHNSFKYQPRRGA